MTCVQCQAQPAADAPPACGCLCGAPETQVAMRRLEADLSRREMLGGVAASLGAFAGAGLAPNGVRAGGGRDGARPLLLTNLRLFNGRDLAVTEDNEILIEGGRIAALPPRGQGPEAAERIDCGGRSVIPGLIDSHWHATLASVAMTTALTADPGYIHLVAAREAGATLRRGFTTVRDTGGPAFALKRAIDEGVVEGPRIFPAGAMISQTSGHGDFRMPHEISRAPSDAPSHPERMGVSAIADGADAVLQRVREQLAKGASQIKMMAGGGVSSLYDPLDVTQYLERELRAGVEAAADWGTYVCVHVYTAEGIKRAIRAGVRCIEHGQLTDEEAVRMMAGEGVWWSLQPFLSDEDANPKDHPAQREKQARVSRGTEQAYEWAEKHGVRQAWGTDVLLNPAGAASQGRQLAKITRFRDPLTALRQATGEAGELLAMSGARAPYDAPLGVLEPGAAADLLVVDGAPERDLSFLSEPETTLRLILARGEIARNTL